MRNVNENEWIISKLGKLLGANDIHKWMGCIVTSVNFFFVLFYIWINSRRMEVHCYQLVYDVSQKGSDSQSYRDRGRRLVRGQTPVSVLTLQISQRTHQTVWSPRSSPIQTCTSPITPVSCNSLKAQPLWAQKCLCLPLMESKPFHFSRLILPPTTTVLHNIPQNHPGERSAITGGLKNNKG